MGCYCEYSEGEGPEFCDTRMVKARKTHRCVECLEPIAIGELHERCAGKWDGDMRTYRTCAHCAELRKSAGDGNHYFEGIAFGQLACWYMNEVQAVADEMDREEKRSNVEVSRRLGEENV